MLVGEDFDAPWFVPPGGPQRRNHCRQIEGALAAIPASVDDVLEERADHLFVGIVEFDADEAVQLYGREVAGRCARRRCARCR